MLSDEKSARASTGSPKAAEKVHRPETESAPKPEPTSDPELEAWQSSVAAFQQADLADKMQLFSKTIDDGLMDDETAFEFLEQLFCDAVAHRELGHFDEAVSMLKQRAPKAYEEEKRYIQEWLLESAILSGRRDAIHPLAMDLVEHAADHVDTLMRVMRLLACHGELELLIRMAEAAWPQIRQAEGIMGWAVDEFATYGAILLLLSVKSETAARLKSMLNSSRTWSSSASLISARNRAALDHLTGRADRVWTMKDFDFPAVPQPVDPPERAENRGQVARGEDERRTHNLWLLSYEFIGWARRQEGIPATLAQLGTIELQTYIHERADARLGPSLSMMDRALNPAKVRATRPFPKPEHVLCPDHQTADRYLGGLVGLFALQHASACAFIAMAPPWVRFLESRGLVDAAVRERCISGMRELAATLDKLLKGQAPALVNALDSWEVETAQA